MKEITSAKFGKYNLVKAKLKRDLYKRMSYSRKFEKESDSLGLMFLKNTKYDALESVKCMKLLDTIDYYKFSEKIDFKKTFDTKEFNFKNRWLKEEKVMFGGSISDNFFERDSIKSHPETKLRARILKNYLTNTNKSLNNNQNNKTFEDFKSQANFEFIKSWVFYQDYGKALFYCLKQLQVEEKNKFLINKTGDLLRLIYDSHKNHTFSQYVDRPSAEKEKEYNQFLNFLDKISLSKMVELSYYYHKKHLHELQDKRTYLENYNYFKTEYIKNPRMKINKLLVSTLLIIFSTICVSGQEKNIKDVVTFELKNIGTIQNNSEITGYYMFYETDKLSRKVYSYELRILDQNLNDLSSKSIEGSKNLYLFDVVYNNKELMLKFYETKKRKFIFRKFDNNLEEIMKIKRKVDRVEAATLAYILENNEGRNFFLQPVDNFGFLDYRIEFKKMKMGYTIDFYPSDPDVKEWSISKDKKSKNNEFASLIYADENKIINILSRSRKLRSKNYNYVIQTLNSKTGELIFEKEIIDENYDLTFLSGFKIILKIIFT